jgi:transcriptional regulator with XRE-family HTH domain
MRVIDVGGEIRTLRTSRGLTQQNVADIFKTSLSRVSKIENNKLDITAREYLEWKDTLSKIHRVAAFTVDIGGSRGRVGT